MILCRYSMNLFETRKEGREVSSEEKNDRKRKHERKKREWEEVRKAGFPKKKSKEKHSCVL